MLEFGFVIARIQFQKQSARFHETVVFDSRIDVANGPTDASAHQVQVALDLGIVRGFAVLRVDPPQCSSGYGQSEDEQKNPARPLSAWRVGFEILFI